MNLKKSVGKLAKINKSKIWKNRGKNGKISAYTTGIPSGENVAAFFPGKRNIQISI